MKDKRQSTFAKATVDKERKKGKAQSSAHRAQGKAEDKSKR